MARGYLRVPLFELPIDSQTDEVNEDVKLHRGVKTWLLILIIITLIFGIIPVLIWIISDPAVDSSLDRPCSEISLTNEADRLRREQCGLCNDQVDFICPKSTKCISIQEQVCNGRHDCDKGSDESDCPPAQSALKCGINRDMFRTAMAAGFSLMRTKRFIGIAANSPTDNPWRVVLYIAQPFSTVTCEGAILSNRTILTAAHCFAGIFDKFGFGTYAYFGIDANNRVEIEYGQSIDRIMVHPLFESASKVYDYAILILARPIKFTSWYIQPLCLPSKTDCASSSFCQPGTKAQISGRILGDRSALGAPQQYNVLKGEVTILHDKTCARILSSKNKTAHLICTSSKVSSTGHGNSGGPMTVRYNNRVFVCGITSFGFYNLQLHTRFNFGGGVMVDVYAPVCPVLDWIKTNMV